MDLYRKRYRNGDLDRLGSMSFGLGYLQGKHAVLDVGFGFTGFHGSGQGDHPPETTSRAARSSDAGRRSALRP